MRSGRAARVALVAALALAAFGQNARAQLTCGTPSVGGAGFTEVWVNPQFGFGNDANPGTQAAPFRTIQRAMLFMGTPPTPLGINNQGLIHLMHGIYSAATNSETFPITMLDFVNIQGAGAKQVVLRGSQLQNQTVFFPTDAGSCTCGSRVQAEVLVDFSQLSDTSYDEMLDAVTLQSGNVQVYAESFQYPIYGRISNCIFDMLDNFVEGYAPPAFGILMVHRWVPGEKEPGHYEDVPLNVFNNTFVQSWDPVPFAGGEPLFSAAGNSVAICDVVDPRCDLGSHGDFNTGLRGVGNPNIQNNLIRAHDATPPTALMGIDDSDVTCVVCTQPGRSNAFDPAAVGGSNGSFCSTVIGAFPLPRAVPAGLLNPNARTGGIDPTFVGEVLSSVGGISILNARDWRILHDSVLVDAGSGPALGALVAANGTAYVDAACTPSSSFDFDGEY
jgi:hypothetical protein